MDKHQLLEKVNTIDKNNFDKTKLVAWVSCLEGAVKKIKPKTYKKGDVLMHQVFAHPYILLHKKSDEWVCGLLTSESTCTEIIEPCESRFFSDSYFTKVIFTAKEPLGQFMGVFENVKQCNSVFKKLKNIFV